MFRFKHSDLVFDESEGKSNTEKNDTNITHKTTKAKNLIFNEDDLFSVLLFLKFIMENGDGENNRFFFLFHTEKIEIDFLLFSFKKKKN